MTNNEIRTAIAKSLGWIELDKPFRRYCSSEGWYPNYPNDLNAMHEVEKTLKPHWASPGGTTAWEKYVSCLTDVVSREPSEQQTGNIHATARQRAEAYLRVKGLWH